MEFPSLRHGTNKCEAPSNLTVTRFVRDADGMCRWGMFDLSSIDSFNVTISTSLGGVSGIHFIACLGWPPNPYDQGGPDVGDRFCQKANQKLCEFLDMFRQMCRQKHTKMFGVRDRQRWLEISIGFVDLACAETRFLSHRFSFALDAPCPKFD